MTHPADSLPRAAGGTAGRTAGVAGGARLFAAAAVLVALMAAGPVPVESTRALQRGCRPGLLAQINPEWAPVDPSDGPEVAEGIVRFSKVSHEDVPFNHDSHDWNFFVRLDPRYEGLNSDQNHRVGDERWMEMEWEIRYFPTEFRPVPGDRVWMLGRWVFDCGHPPYRTEIHPPKAVAFTRLEPVVPPGGTVPSMAHQTYVYINGRAGYYNAPVATQDYAFVIPLPLRPSPQAELVTWVAALPFGGPRPVVTPVTPATGPASSPAALRVMYPLALSDPSPDRQFGAVIVAAWQEPVPTVDLRTLRVTLESIRINHDHDMVGPGEWRMWIRVNGRWLKIDGLDRVRDGDVVRIGQTVTVTVPEAGEVSLEATGWEADCDAAFGVGRPMIISALCRIDNNDEIGRFLRRYDASVNFGIGPHAESSSRAEDLASGHVGPDDTSGDFTLRYRIDEIARYRAESSP